MTLRGQPYVPSSLGCAGSLEQLFKNDEGGRVVPVDLGCYHVLRAAYLLEWWWVDGVAYPYLSLHHLVTSVVLYLAFMGGYTEFGALIIFVHDLANLPTQ